MPSPAPSPRRRAGTLSRRTTLLGAVGTTTIACSPYELQTQRRRPTRPTPTVAEAPTDPDVELAATVVTAVQGVLDRIDATVRRHPRLEQTLAETLAVHDAHVTLLEDAAPDDGPSPSASEPSETATDVPSVEPEPAEEARVPKDRRRALRAVATAEDELALATKQAAFAAESGAFARVLASLAAAATQQSAVLRIAHAGGRNR